MNLLDLEPKAVYKYFNDILNIPRPSGHEDKIREYLIEYSKNHGFSYEVDQFGSIIIDVPASDDRKDAPLVILQGHMDMVPVVEDGFTHDFLNDPVKPYIDRYFIRAEHTTLGADNGIAIAIALALFDDKTLPHGPLRAIFTVEEETTMKGALNLDEKYLKADYLINLDSEENGYLYVSCAGSADINISYKVSRITPEDTIAQKFELSHFTGGHSGTDITCGNANAIKVLASILDDLSENFDFFIEHIDGGFVRNSIPAKASVRVCVPKDQCDEFKKAFARAFDEYRAIYASTDASCALNVTDAQCAPCLSYTQTLDLIHLIRSLPSGIIRMSPDFKGVVETSVNLGTIGTENDCINICMLPRSLNRRGLNDIIKTVMAQCYLLDNVDAEVSNEHEPWSSPSSNRLIDVLNLSARAIVGEKFTITALHAGVECACFIKEGSNLQLVSIGPDIFNPHSIRERISINGINDIYEIVRNALAML